MPGILQGNSADYYFQSDERFNELYPPAISTLASRHWSPLSVARRAAAFLDTHKGARILDIGSGAGKFCIAAAHFAPGTMVYGVEQRRRLLHQAEKVKEALEVPNAHFLHGNFTQVDFNDYDHFYFYNAFYENLDGIEKIDDAIAYSNELFHYYNRCLYRLLDQRPSGTRLVTYHSAGEEVPPDYHVLDSQDHQLLKCWIKA
jgi:SAM-dependent methyltransferase